MPSTEDYIRLRQIGSAQRELGRMQMEHGETVETLANEAINHEEMPEEEDKEKKGMPKNIKVAMIEILRKKKASSTEKARGLERDRQGVPTGHFEHSIKPY